MKTLLISATISIFPGFALAGSNFLVTCRKDNHELQIEMISEKVNYVHRVNGVKVGSGQVDKFQEGFESKLLQSYVWTFESQNGTSTLVVGLAVPGLKKPWPGGKYNGFSDLVVVSKNQVMEADSLPCQVEFSYDID